jgi:hypothetical protein
MADENDENERHPFEVISEKADAINFEDDEDREDWIEAKMRRAGFKRGPGAWVAISDDDDDDDGDHDDDDQPMTRGDWRRMQRDRKKNQNKNYTPPRKPRNDDGKGKKGGGKPSSNDAWW